MIVIFFILLPSNCIVNDSQAVPVTDKGYRQPPHNNKVCPEGEHLEPNMWQPIDDGKPREYVCIPDGAVQK
ncbi:hypothetical protein PRIPAC_71051 [Pristionchus pacificus]|uniref:Uncharacterized protein n=1 Tax=Pristionchus pacificus TaxID=54126 RepID=A0A2A6BRM2_PRIPA|nr:hypothetical protein PRIPAC_71051 [Pristionchus pacificus]|eukprot:PDM68443.1 hypothetical protein PRIPAC_43945 [Pristionchus pacificus]